MLQSMEFNPHWRLVVTNLVNMNELCLWMKELSDFQLKYTILSVNAEIGKRVLDLFESHDHFYLNNICQPPAFTGPWENLNDPFVRRSRAVTVRENLLRTRTEKIELYIYEMDTSEKIKDATKFVNEMNLKIKSVFD